MEKKFTYDDPRYLNKLVMYIEGKNCKLCATLKPDIPEFIDAANLNNYFTKGNSDSINAFSFFSLHVLPIPEFNIMFNNIDFKKIDSRMLHAITMMVLCEKHEVMPFLKLNFDNSYSQWIEPKIEYIGCNFGGSIFDQPYNSCINPVNFSKLNKNKWYSIGFEDFIGEESTMAAKSAISEYIKQGYVITRISATLNPRLRTADHYFDYEESDGQIFASEGVIEISGVSEDFELPKEQKILEYKKPLLENIINNLLEGK